jgi:hypothetical protein
VYGTSPAQYQQAMTVGLQQQQQQVPQYASQQVSVVAAAPAPVPQFHTPTQPASQPTQPKRERKPLPIVNPDTKETVSVGGAASAVAGREVAVTHHRILERATPQLVSCLQFRCVERQRLLVYLRFAMVN